MDSTHVYASHLIGDSATSPSPSSLILSEDNQFALVTKSTIFIYTPSTTIQFHQVKLKQAEAKALFAKGKGKSLNHQNELSMFTTTLAAEKKDIINWQTFSNDFRVVAAGRPEVFWRSAVWSPSGLSQLGGCVLAGLTTNAQVMIYEPPNNAYKGSWNECCDLSSNLTRRLVEGVEEECPSIVLQCQATFVSWSPAVKSMAGDWSILAVGHKSGHISLWRYIEGKSVQLLRRYRISDKAGWINSIAWSPWKVSTKKNSRVVSSYLAIADSAGNNWAIQLTQDCTLVAKDFQKAADESKPDEDDMELDRVEQCGIILGEAIDIGENDGRIVSQSKWISLDDNLLMLVYTKLGTVNFAAFTRPKEISTKALQIKEETELELERIGDDQWVGANSLSMCAGIDYFPESAILLVTLASGIFYTFTLSPTPELIIDSSRPTSNQITKTARKCFAKVARTVESVRENDREKKNVDKNEGMEIKGVTKWGNGGDVGWIYETRVPDSIGYNPTIRTTFVLASLFDTSPADNRLEHFLELLDSPHNAVLESTSHILSSFLHSLQIEFSDAVFVTDLLNKLSELEPRGGRPNVAVIDDVESLESVFKANLIDDHLLSHLRVRETVTRFLLRDPRLAQECVQLAELVYATLARRSASEITGRLGSIMHAADSVLQDDEKLFSARMTMACASLQEDPTVEEQEGLENLDPDQFASIAGSDTCPACNTEIAFDNSRIAKCDAGHVWERCSITLSLIHQIDVRTCMNCERKALISLPEREDNLYEEDLKIVDNLLKMSTCCLYCGGRWMKLL